MLENFKSIIICIMLLWKQCTHFQPRLIKWHTLLQVKIMNPRGKPRAQSCSKADPRPIRKVFTNSQLIVRLCVTLPLLFCILYIWQIFEIKTKLNRAFIYGKKRSNLFSKWWAFIVSFRYDFLFLHSKCIHTFSFLLNLILGFFFSGFYFSYKKMIYIFNITAHITCHHKSDLIRANIYHTCIGDKP